MKTKLIRVGAGTLVLLAALGLFFAGRFRTSAPAFNGTRVRGETQFLLDFTALNGEQTHTLVLAAGDELRCRFDIAAGEADILIEGEHGEKLYRGDKLDQAAFSLTVDTSGRYTVTVHGRQARGLVEVSKIVKE